MPLVLDSMNAELTKPVADEKIKTTVQQMGRLKAPALDGFQGIFLPLLLGHCFGRGEWFGEGLHDGCGKH